MLTRSRNQTGKLPKEATPRVKSSTKKAVRMQAKVTPARAWTPEAPLQPKQTSPSITQAQPSDTQIDISKFKPQQVIDDSGDHKSLTYVGDYTGQLGVLRLEKTSFDDKVTREALDDETLTSKLEFKNDKYHSFMLTPGNQFNSMNSIKATFVWPATEAIIKKYSRADRVFISETPEVYMKLVEPYIVKVLTGADDPNRWVYNILDGLSEKDRVIFNDPDPDSGFMLTKSIKATPDDKDLYLLAICHRRDVRSLRDLNEKHLTMLKNILTKGSKAIKDKYKKFSGQLRMFVHYQPTFYHFHVHFKAVDPSNYVSSDRDHLLSTIVSNLTLNKDYYKKSTFTYPLETTSPLYLDLKKAKKV